MYPFEVNKYINSDINKKYSASVYSSLCKERLLSIPSWSKGTAQKYKTKEDKRKGTELAIIPELYDNELPLHHNYQL